MLGTTIKIMKYVFLYVSIEVRGWFTLLGDVLMVFVYSLYRKFFVY
jgi:hypothetical protein